jgi:nucleoside-diphosphate-sugar epimerase
VIGPDDLPKNGVLVTGALGFVGRHLADRLIARGDRVILTDVQEHAEVPEPATYRRVDVRDYEVIRSALEGVETVYHVASLVQTRQADAQMVWDVNLQGTQNLIRACQEAGVGRLVYVSSASVVYEGANIENGDESLPYAGVSQAPYADSKIAAEKIVLEADDAASLRTCALRPHVVFGPGDGRFFPALVKRAREGSLKYGVGRGRKISDFTYIDNLVDALVSAKEKLSSDPSVGGQAFFITNGEPMAFWEFVDKVLVALNEKPTQGRIPFAVAYVAAMISEWVCALRPGRSNGENGLTRFSIRYMCTHHYFSIDKARKSLGYEPAVGIDEGIARTVASFTAQL